MSKEDRKLLKHFFQSGEISFNDVQLQELLISIGRSFPLQNRGGYGRKIKL